MFLLALLLLTAIVWLLGLAFVIPKRLEVGIYSALSLLFALIGLVLFTLFSWRVGLVRFGVANSLSIPGDYLAQGVIGIVIMFWGILGVLSPALAAWLVSRQSAKPRAGQ